MRSLWMVLLIIVFTFSLHAQTTQPASAVNLSDEQDADVYKHINQTISRITFSSCMRKASHEQAIKNIIDRKPDVHLWLGDNVYMDSSDPKVMAKKYGKLAANPSFQKLMKSSVNLAIWDDHDYGKNNAGKEFKAKDLSKAAFLKVFGRGEKDQRLKRKGLYSVYYFGKGLQRVQIILLDVRYFRGQPGKKNVTALGDEQWAWLEKELKKPATIRIIGSGIQVVADEHKYEHWGKLGTERTKLFNLIKKLQVPGVVFVSGDRHFSSINFEKGALGLYTAWDFTSSGMDHDIDPKFPLKEKHTKRWGKISAKKHRFTEINIDWQKHALSIKMLEGNNDLVQELVLQFKHLALEVK